VLAPALLTGAASMADGTLCLTYDDGPGATAGDGPGPRTLPLATYLADEGVRATFFMCGMHVAQLPDAPARVRALGHLVGNHTWDHPHLPDLHASGGDVVAQLSATDQVLDVPADEPVLVRPPYGHWSATVADTLNDAGRPWVGPVGWDVDGNDWSCWERGAPVDEAASVYLEQIEAAGRGVVLMHDSTADSDEIRAANRAFDLTRALVPELRRRGYRFVGLDAVTLH
jgi:peptidoglycan/xylan/chitin deacetylase (PgdA/CDA1 family)